MISKEDFVGIINSMQEQYAYDLAYSYSLSELVKTDDVRAYDNSLLCKSLIKLLQTYFPLSHECNFCEIEHYCYVINFGKLGEEYESPGDLYDRLCKIKNEVVVDDLKSMKDEFWQRIAT
jgi:hypothetical protein